MEKAVMKENKMGIMPMGKLIITVAADHDLHAGAGAL